MLHKRSIKEKLLKGGAWAFAGKLVTSFTALGANALLARLLSPEEMGAYFLTLSLVSVAAIVAQFGLTQTIVKLVAESMGTDRPARARLAVSWVLRLTGLGALLVACVLAFGGGSWVASRLFHSEVMSQVMGLAAVWAVIISFQQLMAEIFRGFHDIRLATLFGGLVTGLLGMLMFLGLWLYQGFSDLNQVMLLSIVAGFSSITLSSLILWKKLGRLPEPTDAKLNVLEIIRISWPMWITNVSLLLLLQVDLWVMGYFRSPEEVAVYGAASRMVGLLTLPLLIVNSIIPPIIAEMYAQRKLNDLEKTLRKVATITSVPSLIILMLFGVYGESILALVYGGYYKAGADILSILCVGQIVNVLTGSCGLLMTYTGHQKAFMKMALLVGLFSVVVMCLLVPLYGGVGASIATAAQVIIIAVSASVYCMYKIKIKTFLTLNVFG